MVISPSTYPFPLRSACSIKINPRLQHSNSNNRTRIEPLTVNPLRTTHTTIRPLETSSDACLLHWRGSYVGYISLPPSITQPIPPVIITNRSKMIKLLSSFVSTTGDNTRSPLIISCVHRRRFGIERLDFAPLYGH